MRAFSSPSWPISCPTFLLLMVLQNLLSVNAFFGWGGCEDETQIGVAQIIGQKQQQKQQQENQEKQNQEKQQQEQQEKQQKEQQEKQQKEQQDQQKQQQENQEKQNQEKQQQEQQEKQNQEKQQQENQEKQNQEKQQQEQQEKQNQEKQQQENQEKQQKEQQEKQNQEKQQQEQQEKQQKEQQDQQKQQQENQEKQQQEKQQQEQEQQKQQQEKQQQQEYKDTQYSGNSGSQQQNNDNNFEQYEQYIKSLFIALNETKVLTETRQARAHITACVHAISVLLWQGYDQLVQNNGTSCRKNGGACDGDGEQAKDGSSSCTKPELDDVALQLSQNQFGQQLNQTVDGNGAHGISGGCVSADQVPTTAQIIAMINQYSYTYNLINGQSSGVTVSDSSPNAEITSAIGTIMRQTSQLQQQLQSNSKK
ncbi:hypothetical protein niasHT_018924 [Heterodera trifolii]|uniref:Effector protein n=1 Tax=Heterodera trifolii TaxID=157864 RepID=A0ABD2LDN8_9BILA